MGSSRPGRDLCSRDALELRLELPVTPSGMQSSHLNVERWKVGGRKGREISHIRYRRNDGRGRKEDEEGMEGEVTSGEDQASRAPGTVPVKGSGEGEAAARSGDGTAEFLGGFDPFLNDDLDVGKSFLVGLSVGGTAGQLRDFGDKRFVGLTPIDDDLVSRHRLFPPNDN